MRSKEVDEAIKVLDKYKIRLLQTRKEIGLVEDFKNHHTEKQYNRCGKRVKSIETVLAYIEELEEKCKSEFIRGVNIKFVEEIKGAKKITIPAQYIDKQVIRDKIKEYKNLLKTCNKKEDIERIKGLNERILVLEEIIGE